MAAPNCPDGDSLCVTVTETKTLTTSVEWKIKNFVSHIKSVGYSLKSNNFCIKPADDPIAWNLVMYPYGNKVENSSYVSIFLCCERDEGSQEPVPTNICVCLKKKGSTNIIKSSAMDIAENDKANEWGWNRFVHTNTLQGSYYGSGLSANDTLILDCLIMMPRRQSTAINADGRIFPMKKPKCCLRDNLGTILESESFSDVKLTAQGKEFNAHKIILAAMSPVFSAMFTAELKEKKDGVVEITDVEPDVLENLLKFVYTEQIDLESVEMSSGLLAAADKYGLDRLKCLCEDYLCQEITVGNVSELLVLAYLHTAKQLKGTALDFVNSNIILVRKNTKWLTLVDRYPRLLDEILAHHLSVEKGEK